jgi:hypothetical protein
MEDMREHVQESSEKSFSSAREMNSIHTLCTRPCNVGTDRKLLYVSAERVRNRTELCSTAGLDMMA